MNEKNELALVADSQSETSSAITPWVEGKTFNTLSALANKFSQSKLVPEMFQGKPQECFIALQMALRMNEDPFQIIQNITLPKGKPALAAPFAIERCNRLGPFSEPIDWDIEGEGDSLKVTAHAPLKRNGKVVKATVTMTMAKAEGWARNSKYQTMPEQMLCYRSAVFLIRRHAPAILFGIPTSDEVEDIYASGKGAKDTSPAATPSGEGKSRTQILNEKIEESI